MHLNVEIKAKARDRAAIEAYLQAHNADFRGVDHQVDTYFVVPAGRLKLREGNIENSLIFYNRPDQAGPKTSEVHLYHPKETPKLRAVLSAALGSWQTVSKDRAIYFIDNVKFHLDRVEGLGEFVEIEAIDVDGSLGERHIRSQCEHYLRAFGIKEEDLLEQSYSDLLK
ncbi:MAG: class IV adenylate cyclase [Bacteroidota bacterium]